MSDPTLLRVATLGAAHGLRGEVRLRLHTDDPAGRLVPGSRFATDPASAGPLELTGVATRSGTVYARFAGHADRSSAETLRGVVLLAEPQPDADDPDSWYPDDLVGLRVRRDGDDVGTVVGVEHLPAQDVLVIRETGGARTLVPFVTAIVPVVDVAAGYVLIDPPAGLLAADADPIDPDADDGSGDASGDPGPPEGSA